MGSMESAEIRGLDKVTAMLDAAPEIVREARAEVMDEMGRELLEAVRHRIGGTGRVAGAQKYTVGSGKGYVAVRPAADRKLGEYRAGYVTTALEHGHAIRKPNGGRKRKSRAKVAAVPGKHMYRDTRETDVARLSEEAAARLEEKIWRKLDGG